MSAKIVSLINLASQKASCVVSKAVYYGKVGAELSKTVYLKEGLQPPNFSDFELVYWRLKKQFITLSKNPKDAIDFVKGMSSNELFKYGCYGVQFAGLYSLGEVIGRRKLIGYNNYSEKHH